MTESFRVHVLNTHSADRDIQGEAYRSLIAATETPVDWAYEVWDDLVRALSHKDNRLRSIAAQVLCNLAKSDPENRMRTDFAALLRVTKDEKFVTARHCMQALWKVGAAGKAQQTMLVDSLEGRFKECVAEKNCTLIRYDIVEGLRKLYDEVKDENIREKALELIETEDDLKYRKKYASLWKEKRATS